MVVDCSLTVEVDYTVVAYSRRLRVVGCCTERKGGCHKTGWVDCSLVEVGHSCYHIGALASGTRACYSLSVAGLVAHSFQLVGRYWAYFLLVVGSHL